MGPARDPPEYGHPASTRRRLRMTEPDCWDLVVIGGGSAGLIASKTAAGFGASVLLIEQDRLGGDCLWTGCVPSKAMIHVAGDAAVLRRPGADPELFETAMFETAMASVRRAIDTIEPADSTEALAAAGVRVIIGQARFTSNRTLTVADRQIRFMQAVIATGAAAVIPDIPGAEEVHVRSSADVWDLATLPARLLVLGGGAVGCELGQAFARLGSRVTLVHRHPRLLPKEAPDVSEMITAALQRDGLDLRADRSVVSIAGGADGQSGTAILDDGSEVEFDVVLAAVGRRPNVAALGVTDAGVQLDPAGYVRVNRMLRTSEARIWAAGDVTGFPKFTHLAGVNGSIAASNAVLGLRRQAEREGVVRVTFTSPEVAAVGVTDADGAGHRVVQWGHGHADRAITDDAPDGFTRLVLDRRGRILGGTIVGPRAGETAGELALAVRAKLSTSTLAGTTHPYPTYNDALWNAAIVDVQRRLGSGLAARGVRALRWLRSRMLR